jgi:hypothetical protein
MAASKANAALAARVPEPAQPHRAEPEMAMLRLAIDKGAPIETIERLVALQEKMLARKAEVEFNEALNRVQSKIKRVTPDLENPQTRSRYASYAAIDRVIRPIYSEEGFSLSFTERDCPKPEHVRIVCFVSKGAHTREYSKDMPADSKGAKGGDVMTKTHAVAAADSYAKRYLVKDVFNIAIGEDDADGNAGNGRSIDPVQVEELCRQMSEVDSLSDLKTVFAKAYGGAQTAGDRQAMGRYIQAKDRRKKELSDAC